MSESRHGVEISQNPQQGTAEFAVPFVCVRDCKKL